MIELKGKYNTAKVFTNNIDDATIDQIITLLNQPFAADSKIRIMPDCHAGAGCVIGTTMTIKDKIVPNLTGVDIGCGMLCADIGKREDINLEKLDNFIHENIPSGCEVFDSERKFDNIQNLKCKNFINVNRALCSIGTLGGGNHFIEADKDDKDNIYIVIHSGSRYLGKQIAKHYQNLAVKNLRKSDNNEKIKAVIEKLKSEGRQLEISEAIKKIKENEPKIPKELSYIENDDFKNYFYDLDIAQAYAYQNRDAMFEAIIKFLNIPISEVKIFQTIHNYVDTKRKILRKGSVSAQAGEKIIIPMNMRDGSLICLGKGNPDWNYSAPHGAGRIMSRSEAKKNIRMEDYNKSMSGIYTTSVNELTIDESPMVYKNEDEIVKNIQDTATIIKTIKPIYNFKAD